MNVNSEKILMFDNTKGLIRSRKSEEKTCNEQKVNRANKDL
jgi:hypothetical protein